IPTEGFGLGKIAAISPDDIWAVGQGYHNGLVETIIEHWDGTRWNLVLSPSIPTDTSAFYDVAAITANDVWAVGYYSDFSSGWHSTLIEHWDGRSWTITDSPNITKADNVLLGVMAVAANDIWAVGDYLTSTGQHTLTVHWDGSHWSIVASPDPGSSNSTLIG